MQPSLGQGSSALWPASSSINLFLCNLQLLEITKLPDWPGLLPRHFSGGQQTQRQRIKGVEWALYQLFSIWDPESTRNVQFHPAGHMHSIDI